MRSAQGIVRLGNGVISRVADYGGRENAALLSIEMAPLPEAV
jgi:hypothetical protein